MNSRRSNRQRNVHSIVYQDSCSTCCHRRNSYSLARKGEQRLAVQILLANLNPVHACVNGGANALNEFVVPFVGGEFVSVCYVGENRLIRSASQRQSPCGGRFPV